MSCDVMFADGWSWGSNTRGQLGDGTTDNRYVPTPFDTQHTWQMLAGGTDHSVGLQTDGTLWTWGSNDYFQLGDGSTNESFLPTQIGADNDWVFVAAGGNSTMAIKSDGTLWSWGENITGQLGTGDTDPVSVPTQIGSATWDRVAMSELHTLGVQSNGTLWAWGFNTFGQLGDGGTDESHVPLQIGAATNWDAVAVGRYHSMALKTDGTLWTWGYNGYGNLGDGTTDDCDTLKMVGTDTDWASIGAGEFFSLATKQDNSLWAWGDNYAGQLGDGTTDSRDTVAQVGSDTDWDVVISGCGHVVALKTNGSLWGWGDNIEGTVGNGTTDEVLSPVQIGTDLDWTDVGTGLLFSFGIKGPSVPLPIAVCKNITVQLDSMGQASITAQNVNGGSSAEAGILSLGINQFTFNCSNLGYNAVVLTITDILNQTDTCTATVLVVYQTSDIISGNLTPTKNTADVYSVGILSANSYQWLDPTRGEIQGASTSHSVQILWTAVGTDTLRVQLTHADIGCVSEVTLVVSVQSIVCEANPECISVSTATAECLGTTGDIMSYQVTFTFNDILSTANFIRIYEHGQQGGTFTFPFHAPTMTIQGEKRSDLLANDPVRFIIDVYDVLPNGKAIKCSMQRCVTIDCGD